MPHTVCDIRYVVPCRIKKNKNRLKAAEKRENVNLYFDHRVNKVDLKGKLYFMNGNEASGSFLIRSMNTLV